AHLDLVPADEAGRSGNAVAVQEGAVFGRGVVQLTAAADVNQDRAVAAGNAGVGDDHVVVGHSADAVQAGLERVHTVLINQPELDVGRLFARVLNDRVGLTVAFFQQSFAVHRNGLGPARPE